MAHPALEPRLRDARLRRRRRITADYFPNFFRPLSPEQTFGLIVGQLLEKAFQICCERNARHQSTAREREENEQQRAQPGDIIQAPPRLSEAQLPQWCTPDEPLRHNRGRRCVNMKPSARATNPPVFSSPPAQNNPKARHHASPKASARKIAIFRLSITKVQRGSGCSAFASA